MNKENIKKVIEVMEGLEADMAKGSITENYLRKQFGKTQFDLFSSYCLGGNKPFAIDLGAKKIQGEGVHKLTQEGIRELHRLRQELRLIDISEQQTKFNMFLTFFTAILAAGVILQFTMPEYNYSGIDSPSRLIMVLTYLLVIVLIVLALYALAPAIAKLLKK